MSYADLCTSTDINGMFVTPVTCRALNPMYTAKHTCDTACTFKLPQNDLTSELEFTRVFQFAQKQGWIPLCWNHPSLLRHTTTDTCCVHLQLTLWRSFSKEWESNALPYLEVCGWFALPWKSDASSSTLRYCVNCKRTCWCISVKPIFLNKCDMHWHQPWLMTEALPKCDAMSQTLPLHIDTHIHRNPIDKDKQLQSSTQYCTNTALCNMLSQRLVSGSRAEPQKNRPRTKIK